MMLVLSIISIIEFLLLLGAGYGLYRLTKILFQIEDNCQKSIDYIESTYETLEKMMKETYLVTNDPIAQKFVDLIKSSMNAIIFSTNVLKNPSDDIKEVIRMMEKEEKKRELEKNKDNEEEDNEEEDE